jgi:RNA polymerase sigma-70 factor (ECF subfamily)
MDDPELIERFRAGDRAAFDLLVRKYQDRVHNLCRYMLDDPQEAADAAQDTFLRAYRHLGNFVPDFSLYTWLYRIAVNCCIDRKRKRSLRERFLAFLAPEDMETIPSHLPTPEDAAAAGQSRDRLQAALGALSDKLRTVLVLREVEELSYEEIAATLDLSVGTVKSRISRAREEMKTRLENPRNKIRGGSFR